MSVSRNNYMARQMSKKIRNYHRLE